MIQKIMAVYDSAAGAYLTPFFAPTEQWALRAFTQAANNPEHPFNQHPWDYRLFVVGEFDSSSGYITACDPDPVVGAQDVQSNSRVAIEEGEEKVDA